MELELFCSYFALFFNFPRKSAIADDMLLGWHFTLGDFLFSLIPSWCWYIFIHPWAAWIGASLCSVAFPFLLQPFEFLALGCAGRPTLQKHFGCGRKALKRHTHSISPNPLVTHVFDIGTRLNIIYTHTTDLSRFC